MNNQTRLRGKRRLHFAAPLRRQPTMCILAAFRKPTKAIGGSEGSTGQKSLRRNFVYNSIYQILSIVIPLVVTPYLSRTIGADGNGLYSYTQSIANLFVLFAALGVSNYGVRSIAECGDDRQARSRVFWNIFAMMLLVGAIVVAAYNLYCFTLGAGNLALSLIWNIWLVGTALDATWLLFGCQEFAIPTARSILTRVLSLVFIFAFVKGPQDVWAYVLASAAPFLLNSLLIWPFVGRYVDWKRPSLASMAAHLKPNLLLFAPIIATSLYTLLDKAMLGGMAGMHEAGIYDYSEKLTKVPLSLITALGTVVLPKMSEVVASGKLDEAKRLIKTTMWFMLACAFAMAFGIAAIAPEFVPLFLGDGFDACVPLMMLLAVIIPLISATNVMGVQYLVPTHRDRAYTGTVLCGAAVNIIINMVAIPSFGAAATAVATVAAELTVLAAQSIAVRHELDLRGYLKGCLPFAIMGAAMFAIVRAFVFCVGHEIGSQFLLLCIEIAIGAGFFLFVSLAWCRVTRNEQFARLFPRFAR